MEYTKGEWEVDPDCDWVMDDNGIIIANCAGHQDQRVNARLIAAAPELYEALMEFPHYLTSSNLGANEILDRIREWRHHYWQPAIAKVDNASAL